MYRALRGLDRELHAQFYPQIFYPEIYVLEGGFKEFHRDYPQLCDGTYVPMEDKSFKKECKDKFSDCRKQYKAFSTKNACSKILDQ